MVNQYGAGKTIRENIFNKIGAYQMPGSVVGARRVKEAREKYAMGEARKGYVDDDDAPDTTADEVVNDIAPEIEGTKRGLDYKQAQRIMGREVFDSFSPQRQAALLDAVKQMSYKDARMYLKAQIPE